MSKLLGNTVLSIATLMAGLTAMGTALASGDPAGHTVLAPDQIQWVPNPALKGSEVAVLSGDPKKAGPYVMRIKFPPNTNNLPHTHPDNRVVTIVSGTWYFGHGDKFDASKGKILSQGAFFTEPGGAVHYNFTRSEPVIIQVHGMGPTGTTPVKP